MDANPEYVLVLYSECKDGGEEEFVFIRKNKPAWQAGKLNLVGGKIENLEDPCSAGYRELAEETGLWATTMEEVGLLVDGSTKIHLLRGRTFTPSPPFMPREEDTEVPAWFKWKDIRDDKDLIPNLRVIVPLMMSGITNFVIESSTSELDATHHTVKVSVQLPNV